MRGGVMDIHEAREAFERRQAKALNMPYEGLKAHFDENSRLFGARYNTGSINEKEWIVWLDAWQARAQAVPEGFVLVEKKSLRDTYYWDGCEYVVDHPSEYEMELERGEITTLEKWQRTKETKVYCANIYSNEDDFEVVQFETAEEAEKAVAENKAMIEAQEQAND